MYHLFFSSIYLSIFLFHQQCWFQNLLASYWWIFLPLSVISLSHYLGRVVRKQRRYLSLIMLGLLSTALYKQAIKVSLLFVSSEVVEIEKSSPDIMVQFETSPNLIPVPGARIVIHADCHQEESAEGANQFKYHLLDKSTCLRIYSQAKLLNPHFRAYGEDLDPLFSTQVEVSQGRVLNFNVVNLKRTSNQDEWNAHRITLRRLSTDIRHTGTPTLVIGEFGSSLFGRIYDGFVDASRTEDAWSGAGILPFTKSVFPFGFPTQHALYKGAVVTEFLPSTTGFLFSFNLLPDEIQLLK